MFGIFKITSVSCNYYKQDKLLRYRRRYVQEEAYLLNAIHQMQEYDAFQSLLYRSLASQPKYQKDEIKSDKNDIKAEKEETSEARFENEQKQTNKSVPIYYYESHSRFNDDKLVEERKERKIDSEGKVHHSLMRRLDDQWYQTEKTEDEEGKITTKEAWHNVSEDEIESFKDDG